MIWRAKLHVLAYTGSLWECEDGVKLSADCTAECEPISDSWPWGGILYVTCHCTYACAPLYMPYICMSMSIKLWEQCPSILISPDKPSIQSLLRGMERGFYSRLAR